MSAKMALRQFISKIEQTPLTFIGWFSAFLGVLFVKYLLEAISTRSSGSLLTVDLTTVVHDTLFYLASVLAVMLIIHYLTRKDVIEVARVVIVGMITIWLAPLFDLLISSAPFFGPVLLPGVTIGVWIELILILLGILVYIYSTTRSLLRGLVASFMSCTAIFLLYALPSVIERVIDPFHSMENFFRVTLHSSLLSTNHDVIKSTLDDSTMLLLNISMGQVLFIITSLLCLAWFLCANREKAVSVLKNSRPERVGFYMVMTLIGIFLAVSGGPTLGNVGLWANVVMFVVLALSLYAAAFFAIGVNDIVDIEVDRVSNPIRPLVVGTVTRREMAELNVFFLSWSLLGAFLVGWNALFFLSAWTASYYVYSAPPLQLKRVPGVATFLISIACLSTAMMGFFSVSADKSLGAFPPQAVLLIIVVFTLGGTVKDIKDVKGDAKEGVKTLPVILGEKNGRRLVGLLLLVSFWLVPLILQSPGLYFLSLSCGLIGFYLVNRKKYKELPVFILYFIFVFAALIYLFSGGHFD